MRIRWVNFLVATIAFSISLTFPLWTSYLFVRSRGHHHKAGTPTNTAVVSTGNDFVVLEGKEGGEGPLVWPPRAAARGNTTATRTAMRRSPQYLETVHAFELLDLWLQKGSSSVTTTQDGDRAIVEIMTAKDPAPRSELQCAGGGGEGKCRSNHHHPPRSLFEELRLLQSATTQKTVVWSVPSDIHTNRSDSSSLFLVSEAALLQATTLALLATDRGDESPAAAVLCVAPRSKQQQRQTDHDHEHHLEQAAARFACSAGVRGVHTFPHDEDGEVEEEGASSSNSLRATRSWASDVEHWTQTASVHTGPTTTKGSPQCPRVLNRKELSSTSAANPDGVVVAPCGSLSWSILLSEQSSLETQREAMEALASLLLIPSRSCLVRRAVVVVPMALLLPTERNVDEDDEQQLQGMEEEGSHSPTSSSPSLPHFASSSLFALFRSWMAVPPSQEHHQRQVRGVSLGAALPCITAGQGNRSFGRRSSSSRLLRKRGSNTWKSRLPSGSACYFVLDEDVASPEDGNERVDAVAEQQTVHENEARRLPLPPDNVNRLHTSHPAESGPDGQAVTMMDVVLVLLAVGTGAALLYSVSKSWVRRRSTPRP